MVWIVHAFEVPRAERDRTAADSGSPPRPRNGFQGYSYFMVYLVLCRDPQEGARGPGSEENTATGGTGAANSSRFTSVRILSVSQPSSVQPLPTLYAATAFSNRGRDRTAAAAPGSESRKNRSGRTSSSGRHPAWMLNSFFAVTIRRAVCRISSAETGQPVMSRSISAVSP